MIMITNFANVGQSISMTQIAGPGTADCSYLPVSYTHSCGATYTITSPPSSLSNVGYTLQPGTLTSTTPTFVISPTVSATYSVFCSGINSQNVIQTFSGTVGVNFVTNNTPTLIPFSSSPTICVGQSVTIDVIATSNYTWSNGVNNTPFTTSPSVTTSYTVWADSTAGCTGSAVVTQFVDLCTGVEIEKRYGRNLTVYPNPSSSYIYVVGDAGAMDEEFYLKDVLGKRHDIWVSRVDDRRVKITFNVPGSGIYFLVIKSKYEIRETKLSIDL
jgi:hypothetical protein